MCDRLHRVLSICSHLLTLSDLSKSMWQTALRVLSIFSYLLTQSVTCSLTDQIVLRVSSVYSPLLTLSDLSRSFWQAALKVLSICSHLLTLICQGMCDRLHQVLSICSHLLTLICQGMCDRLHQVLSICSHLLTLSVLSRSMWQTAVRRVLSVMFSSVNTVWFVKERVTDCVESLINLFSSVNTI